MNADLAFVLRYGVALVLFATLAEATAPAADQQDIRILQIQEQEPGGVQVMPPGASAWVITQTNQVLLPGYRLRSGKNCRVTLLWSDHSIVPFGPLTEIEILEPERTDSLLGMNLVKGIISFFHRDKPGRIRILSRGTTASIEGTEFVMQAGDAEGVDQVMVAVIEGRVDFSNANISLSLTNNQQAVASPGQGPVPTRGFIANNLLQWCFYYPGVLDLDELALEPEVQQALKESLDSYRSGDLVGALAKYPASQIPPQSNAEKVYHAGLLLAVGQVEQTQADLRAIGSSDPTYPLVEALRTVIAAVKHEPKPTARIPVLATELLAASYYEQSRGLGDKSLRAALDFAQRATAVSPQFGFAWARVAELEFGFGRTEQAALALDRSLDLSPANAQALALKGFTLAARDKIGEATREFNRAIEADSALGNAWLGRGLCRIRSGDDAGGRTDLLVAAALEPQRSLLRSYLGKAFMHGGETKLAEKEFAVALHLDPDDPTGWLYSALLKQEQNRINEAVDDLEKSLALNDNRSLFRSRLLLDQDRAIRSASLASIYQEDGMNEVSLREAAKAVTYDYANYSAHLFLANSYELLRDPTRFNLRYETPWFNELLLANLLAPAGVPTLSPNISQQEYFRLFEKDRLGLTTTTDYRSDGQYREVASQFGALGKFSYSLDLDWQHNDGVRPNNELDRTEWYSQLKYQLTPQDSLMVITKYQDYHSGDNFQYFDPNRRTVVTNQFTGAVTTNTAYSPNFTFDESQDPIVLGAYHREWSPGVHTLALGGRLVNDQRLSDQAVPLYVLVNNPTGGVASVTTSDFDVSYHSDLTTWIGELSQIFETGRNTLILGGRYQSGEFDTKDSLSNVTIFTAFFPVTDATVIEEMQRWSIYAYDTLELIPSRIWLTAGLSYDSLQYPANFRQVPISTGQASEDCLGPKGALVWSPSSVVTVRGAYSRSLGGVSLDESYRLEPPQLAGFNQSYRTIISESLVGSVSAPKFEIAGAALDLKFNSRTYVGLVGEYLQSDVNRLQGVYRFPDSAGLAYPSATPQTLDYHEYSGAVTVNQLLGRDWAVGVSYKFIRSDLDQTLTQVPVATFAGAQTHDSSDLHRLLLYLLFNHPTGFFARAEANWYLQNNLTRARDASGQWVETDLPGDDFWQLNFWVGYRFRRNRGDISVGLLNATDTDYTLSPLNPYAELPRERVVAARLRLRF